MDQTEEQRERGIMEDLTNLTIQGQGQGQAEIPTPPKPKPRRGKHFLPPIPFIRQHKRFYKRDLTFVPLENDEEVHIVNFSKFNRVLIVHANMQRERLDLSDAITEQALQEEPIQEVPNINEILIGPMDDDKNKFYRCFVYEIFHQKDESTKIHVKFFDSGHEAVLDLKDLKPVNAEIMGHPIFGREVILDGIPEYNRINPIFWSDFKSYMGGVNNKLKILITDDEDDEKPTVILYRRKKKSQTQTTKTINEEIIDLGKWQWEKKLEGGYVNDEAMIAQIDGGTDLKIFYNEMITATTSLPLDTEMEMTILICIDHENLMCFPNDSRFPFAQEFQTLQDQIARYCAMVKKHSAFYPELNQVHLFKTEEDKWVRASRNPILTDEVFSVDEGTRFQYLARKNETRPIPPDFARIPLFGIQSTLLDASGTLSKEHEDRVKEILKPNSVHMFFIRSYDRASGVYTLQCPDLITKLAKKIGRNKKN